MQVPTLDGFTHVGVIGFAPNNNSVITLRCRIIDDKVAVIVRNIEGISQTGNYEAKVLYLANAFIAS